jgi:hypothetical protein
MNRKQHNILLAGLLILILATNVFAQNTGKFKPGVVVWNKDQSSKIKLITDTTLIIAGSVILKPGDILFADEGFYKVKEINLKADETVVVYEAPAGDEVFEELIFEIGPGDKIGPWELEPEEIK